LLRKLIQTNQRLEHCSTNCTPRAIGQSTTFDLDLQRMLNCVLGAFTTGRDSSGSIIAVVQEGALEEKILAIDDSADLLRILQVCLEREDYEVFTAGSGREGLQRTYSVQPDLVILDVMMPGMDGWEVLSRLREMSEVPIIMLTAKGREADIVRGLGLGADDYIVKPFGTAELIARVQALLRRNKTPAVQRRTRYQDNGLSIDLERHAVCVNGTPVDLTPTEFRLLSVLVQNAGKVVPHRSLLTQVWGEEYANEVHYLKLYIRYLRQKIEEAPSNPRYILTEWGVGYRFREPAVTG
jgi:two-component system KDP operon response regulator KdpE